jgi:phage terminase large subunit GpA-like protein
MLTIEERGSDGAFHCPKGARNEAIDCRVMALCAGDIYLDALVMDLKAAAKASGATTLQLADINHKYVLQLLIQGMI